MTATLTKQSTPRETKSRQRRRANRYDQRQAQWTYSRLKRCRMCGRAASSKGTPEVVIADGVAHFANVQTCGSIWACPVCSPKIRQERALELDRGMQAWMAGAYEQLDLIETNQPGNNRPAILFGTFTAPHDLEDELKKLYDAQKHAWTRMFGGRAWKDDRIAFSRGEIPWVRAWDATHGEHGWHPHAHAVLFLTRTPTAAELVQLEDRLYERWADAIEDAGYRRPSREHGIKLELARTREDLARYIAQLCVVTEKDDECKVAFEVARTDVKLAADGRQAPFQILEQFRRTGDCEQLELWHDWEISTKGMHGIQWSRGLKKLLKVAERTDEEIAAAEIGGETIHHFTAEGWMATCRIRGGQRRVLEAAETGGAPAVAVAVAKMLHVYERHRRARFAVQHCNQRAPP